MSRNASGTYSLPAGHPVASGTPITATAENALANDIATELTNSLDRTGKGPMQAVLKLTDGSVAAPGVAFNNETGTGLYRAGSQDVRLAVNGADVIKFSKGSAIARAWALLAVGNAGAVTVTKGSNVASASWATSEITITLTNALDDTNCLVHAGIHDNAGGIFVGKGYAGTTTATVRAAKFDMAGALANFANGDTVQVLVFD